jgi:hypothetical protein
MDAINHCVLTRAELRDELAAVGALGQVVVPEDGEELVL